MKKHTSKEKQPKFATPTKRKWNSKVTDLLTKTYDKYCKDTQVEIVEKNARAELPISEIEEMLARIQDFVPYSDVEQLIEESKMLNMPEQTDNLKRLFELDELVKKLTKEIETLQKPCKSSKVDAYFKILLNITKLGLFIPASDHVSKFIENNKELIRGIQQTASLSQLQTLADKCKSSSKNLDSGLIQDLNKKQEKLKKLSAKAEDIVKVPQLCLVDEKALRKIVAEIEDNMFEFEGRGRIEAMISLIDQIKALNKYLFTSTGHNKMDIECIDDEEEEDLSDIIQKVVFRLKDMLELDQEDSVIEFMKDCAGNIKFHFKSLNIEDSEVNAFINKLDSVVWRHNAKEVLEQNVENEEELSKILQSTPKDVQVEGCKEYSQLKERVHAIQAAYLNEKRIVDKLDQYWNDESLHSKDAEVRSFAEETKSYILNKKIERKVEVLELILESLKNLSDATNLEDLVDEMSDLKLQNTKIYEKISIISKSSEKAKKMKGWLQMNKKKSEKYRTG